MRTFFLLLFAVVMAGTVHADGVPPSSLSWIVRGPSGSIKLSPTDRIAITITPAKDAVKSVHVVSFDAIEQTVREPIAVGDIQLCTSDDPTSCKTAVDVPSAQTIWLKPAKEWPSAGHFVGTIVLASTAKPEGESVSLDVYFTETWEIGLGFIAILAGVALSWGISQWGRNRLNRGQLLMLAANVRERVRRVTTALSGIPVAIPASSYAQTKKRIDDLLDALSEAKLEQAHFIPPRLPSPFAGSTLEAAGYKTLLDTTQAWTVTLFGVIAGMRKLAAARVTANQAQVDAAIASLDDLSGARDPLSNADLVKIDQIVNKVVAPAGGEAPKAEPTSDELQLQLTRTSALVWLAVSAITALVGFYAIVLSNLGFGLLQNYAMCVLWGLGFPTGAALLQQTSQSVTQVLKLG